jgi:hypothetical protein
MKPRRAPNKTEKLAAVLLLIKRGDSWLVPEPVRSSGDAKAICASVEWHHDVHHAIRPHNDPRLLTPLAPAAHKARFARDVKSIAKVRRGLKRRRLLAREEEIEAAALEAAGQGTGAFPDALDSTSRPAPKRVMPGSKASPWKRRMDGNVERGMR